MKEKLFKSPLMTPEEVAAYLGLEVETLNVWRCTKRYNLGVSIETDRDFGVINDDHHHHTYAIANVYHELSTGTVVNVDGTDLVNQSAPWIGEIGIGTSYDWNQKNGNPAALFGELNVRTDLDNFGESYGLNLSAGINIGF